MNYNLTTETEQFLSDLHNAFSHCTTGFNENALRDDYSKTFKEPKDIENNNNQNSSTYSTSLIILLGFIFLLFCYFYIVFYLI